ncbi:MFS transporter [Streptomyces plumbiresistens]|uniref:MFS transporter n=1 Tax=Streptomyces plumbiresistens TaxID=511811 RepID=A0ABP7SLC9_9ACTN
MRLNAARNETPPPERTGEAAASTGQIRKVLTGATLGTTLEWFDFGLYGAMSSLVFPDLFFPSLTPVTGVLASFATFGIGLAVRPVGAFFFASVGDRLGRKNAMVVSLIMMGVSSLLIALLPGYATLGLAAPCLLILLRCVQGFSLGGESTAAQIMAMEYAPPGRRALYGAVVNMGSPAGQVLIALVLLGLRGAVGEDAFVSWAWRIPFVIGFGLAIVGYALRRKVEESPAFRAALQRKATTDRPLATVLRTHRSHIIRLTFLWAANIACSYMVTTYSLEYLKNTLGLSSTTGFTLVLVANLLGMAGVPLGGWLADRYGRKPVLLTFAAITLLGVLVYFPLLNTRSWPLMLLAMVVTLVADYIEFGVLAALFAEPYPTELRYSGHASAYTFANLLGGSPTPFVAALLLDWTGSPWSIAGLLAAAYVLSLILIARTPETKDVDFHGTAHVDARVS